jgi:hypothetical protein
MDLPQNWQDKKTFIIQEFCPDDMFLDSINVDDCKRVLESPGTGWKPFFRHHPQEEKQFWKDLTINTPKAEIRNVSARCSVCFEESRSC